MPCDRQIHSVNSSTACLFADVFLSDTCSDMTFFPNLCVDEQISPFNTVSIFWTLLLLLKLKTETSGETMAQ